MAQEDADESQKTEEPTSKKLAEARKKGQVPKSQELQIVFSFLSLLIFILFFIPMVGTDVTISLKRYLEMAHALPTDGGGLGSVLLGTLRDTALALVMPVLAMIFLALVSGVIQNGVIISAENMKPKLEKISPLAGFKRLFSMQSVVMLLKGLLKLGGVGSVSVALFMPAFDALDHYVALEIVAMLHEMWQLAVRMMGGVLCCVIVIAFLDLVYEHYKFNKQMRMTKQEVKDEHKQSEGDPMVKGRIRQIRMERARQRMMSNVPKADVVVTNPTHFAVALQYSPESMDAPRVVAKGADEVAARIREVAKENKVPIMRNPPLARALFAACDIDDSVPAEHFKAVAEIISYVFKLKGRKLG
jgi:flagellar biosynthesis protein FlhB